MINIETLKEFLGSDEEFIVTLMDKFISEFPRDSKNLKAATDQKDWPKVRAISHKMLSSTKIFNLDELTMVLQKIEKLSEARQDPDQIIQLVADFQTSCSGALRDIKAQKDKIKANRI